LVEIGVGVTDRADLRFPAATPARDPESHVIAPDALAAMIGVVNESVAESLDRDGFPLVIGGDCPVLIGCLGGAARWDGARVLFVDGHEDAWPPELSTTGEAADMELGWLLGRSASRLPAQLRAAIPTLSADDVIVLGARDAHELADAGVASLGGGVRIIRPEALKEDPRGVATEAASTLARRGPWWLHVDLDVLSTNSLAAVDYPQPGGLDWRTLIELTRGAMASPWLLGWDVTIYNPDLDPDAEGARRIVGYITSVLGRSDGA
jgi:arginase